MRVRHRARRVSCRDQLPRLPARHLRVAERGGPARGPEQQAPPRRRRRELRRHRVPRRRVRRLLRDGLRGRRRRGREAPRRCHQAVPRRSHPDGGPRREAQRHREVLQLLRERAWLRRRRRVLWPLHRLRAAHEAERAACAERQRARAAAGHDVHHRAHPPGGSGRRDLPPVRGWLDDPLKDRLLERAVGAHRPRHGARRRDTDVARLTRATVSPTLQLGFPR
mmetsp:Transcript_78242/g.221185  ORF Transcript_78242/g.221185 Transcript_78242/m.221185 type:complete len:223 (+) Transcript_78242:398-1066(+)